MNVSIDGVGKSFGDLAVLTHLDLAATAGEFVAIIGPSGCGKSTLFNILAGLESADTGTIEVAGEDPAVRKHCAYMPQKDLLFPWRTVLDNTTLGLEVQGVPKRIAREQARKLFDAFGIAGFEEARPAQLSGGMRQRAAMLRTVVQGRPVLLLDEPFGALDSLTRTDMQKWLQEVWTSYPRLVLMITHDIREALFLADRVVVLSPRPARVTHVVDVDLPRPRDLETVTSPRFVALERELLAALARA